MNIIKIDIDMNKIKIAIQEYMQQIGTTINYQYPIVLMNKDTLLQIQKEYQLFFKKYCKKKYDLKSSNKIFGCYIAIADWLPFGEVQLR